MAELCAVHYILGAANAWKRHSSGLYLAQELEVVLR